MAEDWKTELYKDLAKPVATPVGETLGVVCSYLIGVETNKKRLEYLKKNARAFISYLGNKLSNGKTLNGNPRLNISVPTLEAMSLTEDENVNEMFSELLAKEFTKEESGKVMPVFVDIVKNLTADEAKILNHINAGIRIHRKYLSSNTQKTLSSSHLISRKIPFVQIKSQKETEQTYQILQHAYTPCFDNISMRHPENLYIYLNNLKRCGIIDTYTEGYLADIDYDKLFEEQQRIKNTRKKLSDEGKKIVLERRYINFSDFGEAFMKAVKKDAHIQS